MQNHEIMLDLETFSLDNKAAVVTIGAVKWRVPSNTEYEDNKNTADFLGEEFHVAIDLKSCMDQGLVVDADTICWWFKQSQEARDALFHQTKSLTEALAAFDQFVGRSERGKALDISGLWGNGADFDNVILRNAYTAAGMNPPWSHRQHRCYRTLKELEPSVELKRVGVHHNALDDAKTQAVHAIHIMKYLCL